MYYLYIFLYFDFNFYNKYITRALRLNGRWLVDSGGLLACQSASCDHSYTANCRGCFHLV